MSLIINAETIGSETRLPVDIYLFKVNNGNIKAMCYLVQSWSWRHQSDVTDFVRFKQQFSRISFRRSEKLGSLCDGRKWVFLFLKKSHLQYRLVRSEIWHFSRFWIWSQIFPMRYEISTIMCLPNKTSSESTLKPLNH